jgi:hypothetical protein
MNDKDTVFPQYRKLANQKTFYKIINERLFEEIQLVGTLRNKFVFEAKQYPEILKIKDMLMLAEGHYLPSSQEEWEKVGTL